MHFYFIIGMLSVWINLGNSSVINDKLKESLMDTVMDCQRKSGASEVDIQTIKSRKLPRTETGLCMLECIFNKVKIMEEGKFNKDGMIMAVTPLLKGDLTKLGQIRELGNVCERDIGKGTKGKCQEVKLLVECVGKYGKQYGLQIPQ